jgi:DNA end-binding protein Ku
MARKLIDEMSADWDPETYRDTYLDAILELAARKVRAGKAHELTQVEAPAPERRSAEIVDLAELLKRSLGKRGESAPHGKPAPKRGRRAAR